MLTFQIVGIRYSQPMGELKNIGDHIKNNLLYRDDSISVEIPQQMYDSLPEDLKFDDIIKENNNPSEEILSSEDFAPRVLEFSSLDVARKFLENETCTRLGDKCSKKFYGSAFGSNYLILNEASDLFLQTSVVVLLVILMLATSIIWFTVSRIMSDRRKETAVYRAMGAKRTDIFAIYGSYVSMLALIISCLSLLFGASAAAFVDRLYSNELANAATAALGGAEESLHFSLFKVDVPILLVILALIFIVCFVASLHPLIHNSRRMPINDLREE